MVAPFTGAWVEMSLPLSPCRRPSVAPFTGAWVEIPDPPIRECRQLPSHPSRVRGLKSSPDESVDQADVAPFTGAWVEIVIETSPTRAVSVAPFTGAWVEISVLLSLSLSLVAPFTGAWVEMRAGRTHVRFCQSHPSRVRGLK